jgi:hypothetical protein
MNRQVIIFVLFAVIGCKKTLQEDPRGQVVGSPALGTVDGLNAALTGAYKPLGNTWTTGFMTAATVGVLMGSDDLTTHPASNKAAFREFDQFNVTPMNDRMAQIWSGCYKSIQGANNIINNYKKTAGDAATINQIVGEAYFLRAFDYFWLVRLWDSIPLITSEVYTPEILRVTKSGPADIYSLIEKDLVRADSLMQDKKTDEGRASRGAAKAVLAEVYLTEGGWPLNNQAKYALAAAKAREVIDNKTAFGFDFTPDLATLWSNLSSGSKCAEEVFALHACGTCNWFTSNALFGLSCMPSEENGWDDYYTELNFFNQFPAGVRKDVTFHTTITKPDGTTIPWQQTAVKHPYFAKFRLAGGETIWQTSATLPLMRYAQVLLTYAEAQARAENAPNTQAYDCINTIRSRAGLAPLSGLSANDFIDAVVNERAWEFAGEYLRWFDIVRLQLLPQINAARDPSENAVIGPVKYTLPIPGGDKLLNPNL